MARIRFKGTLAANVPTPPMGRASLFYDDSDNSLKMKLPTGDTLALGVTEEYIQDIVGGLFQDSSSINVTYDDLGNAVSLELNPNLINDYYVDKISPTKIIDSQNGRYEASIITNNGSYAPIYSLDCSINGSWLVELKITSRRLGGTAGSDGDGATFKRTFRIKSINSSVTIHDLQSDYTSRDNPLMNVAISVSSTNVVINVRGVNNNNMKWNADIISSINT